MKLGYLVSQYPAANHTYLLREIRALRSLDFDVVVVSVAPPDRPLERMTATESEEAGRTAAIKSVGVAKAVWLQLTTAFTRPVGYWRGLVTALRLSGPGPRGLMFHLLYLAESVIAGRWFLDRGVSHFHVQFASTVGYLATKVYPLSMSVTFHGPDEFADPAGFHLKEKVEASLFVCTISHYGRSRVMKLCAPDTWPRIEVSYLGVDPAEFTPGQFRDEPDPAEIICVGRLAPVKAQQVLLGAVSRLVQQGRNVRLTLVGDGPDRGALEAWTAELGLGDHVVFTGRLNQDEVLARYRQTDVFALASFDEGLPVVLMEAMAMEIPCVATHITGTPELIRHGVDGVLVAPSDEEGMAREIARLLDDKQLRRRLGRAARERVVDRFDLEKNSGHLAQIFRERLVAAKG